MTYFKKTSKSIWHSLYLLKRVFSHIRRGVTKHRYEVDYHQNDTKMSRFGFFNCCFPLHFIPVSLPYILGHFGNIAVHSGSLFQRLITPPSRVACFSLFTQALHTLLHRTALYMYYARNPYINGVFRVKKVQAAPQ